MFFHLIFLKKKGPPELETERTWVHAGEGHEAQLVCIVHGEANPEVTCSGAIYFAKKSIPSSLAADVVPGFIFT
jgi:hypothetical protein